MDRTRWRIGALCLAWSLGACFPEPKIKGDTDPGDVDAATAEDTAGPVDTWVIDTSPGEPPAVPTAVVASVDRSSEVEVRWQGSAGAVSYRVERCAQDDCAPAAAWVAVTEEPLAATFYVDDDVSVPGAPPAPAVVATDDLPDEVLVTWDDVAAPPAPTYRYRVVAIGEGGESAPSEVAVGSAADRPVIGYEIGSTGARGARLAS